MTVVIPFWALPALVWAALFLSLFWDNLRSGRLTAGDFVFIACFLFLPLAFSAAGRYLP